MTLNKQSLREAAERATPGRIGDRIDGSGSIKYECRGYDGSLVLRTDHKNMEFGFIGDNGDADELFFRLCVPDVVLALLDELETKEEQRANWFQMAQKLGEDLDAAEKRIAELEALTLTAAATDVLAERQRQISAEGWNPEHDDEHVEGQLSDAAACYALFATDQRRPVPAHWPWSDNWWKQSGQRRDLVKAGALILAEIERIDRAAGIKIKGE